MILSNSNKTKEEIEADRVAIQSEEKIEIGSSPQKSEMTSGDSVDDVIFEGHQTDFVHAPVEMTIIQIPKADNFESEDGDLSDFNSPLPI